METKIFPTLPWVLLYTCGVIPLSMSIIVLLKRKNEVNIRDMNMCDLRGYLVLFAEQTPNSFNDDINYNHYITYNTWYN